MALFSVFLYFGAGVLFAFCLTAQIRLIAQCKELRASILSFFLQLINLFVLAGIVMQLNADKSFAGVLANAFGMSVGTYIALRFRHLEGEHKKNSYV